jgi:fatty-acyl-CoA synthase
MAAIAGAPDLAGLWAHLAARLPDYARPVFLRLTDAIEVTSTFKHRKNGLMGEGFAAATDPVFVADRERGAYVPLDAALLARIQAGKLRF